MTPIAVEVPDEALATEIDGWQDGAEYTLRVRQDAPGQFTALSAEEAVEEEAEPTEEAPEMPPKPMPGGKMPAVAIVLAGRKGK